MIYDSSYRQIATVKAANGYSADLHDFAITPQGTALITVYDPVRMRPRLGRRPARRHGARRGVQEIDIHTGLVLFEWHSLGHVA